MIKYLSLTITVLMVLSIMGITGCLDSPDTAHVKWGMTFHDGDILREETEQHIEDLGIELIRNGINWGKFEPVNGVFEYNRFDPVINKYGAENFVMILIGQPAWAEQLYHTDKEAYWDEYQEYVKAVCTRYDCYYYQIDNEMNHIVGALVDRWLYDYEDRPIVIQKADEILNEYDPTHQIVINVMANSPNWYTNLNYWLEQAGDSIDIIALDHYSETWTARANKWRPMNIVMEEVIRKSSNFYKKDIAICETGYATYREATHGDIQQERWINIELKELRDITNVFNSKQYDSKFVFVVWYELYDDSDSSPYDYNPERHFGIVNANGTLKMGYDDLKAQIAGFT